MLAASTNALKSKFPEVMLSEASMMRTSQQRTGNKTTASSKSRSGPYVNSVLTNLFFQKQLSQN